MTVESNSSKLSDINRLLSYVLYLVMQKLALNEVGILGIVSLNTLVLDGSQVHEVESFQSKSELKAQKSIRLSIPPVFGYFRYHYRFQCNFPSPPVLEGHQLLGVLPLLIAVLLKVLRDIGQTYVIPVEEHVKLVIDVGVGVLTVNLLVDS